MFIYMYTYMCVYEVCVCEWAREWVPHSFNESPSLSILDPVVASLAQDIFKELAQIEACQGPMQMRLIPTLVSIMQAPPDKIPSGLCAVSAVNCAQILLTWSC